MIRSIDLDNKILEAENNNDTKLLKELYRKKDLLIEIDIDKDYYHKKLSDDAVINITGESGSGKSTLCEDFNNNSNFIVIDTDNYSKDIINYFDGDVPDKINDFDKLYLGLLDCFKNSGKIIVIDSAQFRNVKDISILKGEIFILRTCVNNCYYRCLKRYDEKYPNSSIEDRVNYQNKKKNMYKWYNGLNDFILRIDEV